VRLIVSELFSSGLDAIYIGVLETSLAGAGAVTAAISILSAVSVGVTVATIGSAFIEIGASAEGVAYSEGRRLGVTQVTLASVLVGGSDIHAGGMSAASIDKVRVAALDNVSAASEGGRGRNTGLRTGETSKASTVVSASRGAVGTRTIITATTSSSTLIDINTTTEGGISGESLCLTTVVGKSVAIIASASTHVITNS